MPPWVPNAVCGSQKWFAVTSGFWRQHMPLLHPFKVRGVAFRSLTEGTFGLVKKNSQKFLGGILYGSPQAPPNAPRCCNTQFGNCSLTLQSCMYFLKHDYSLNYSGLAFCTVWKIATLGRAFISWFVTRPIKLTPLILAKNEKKSKKLLVLWISHLQPNPEPGRL